jgi:hypothetical protein
VYKTPVTEGFQLLGEEVPSLYLIFRKKSAEEFGLPSSDAQKAQNSFSGSFLLFKICLLVSLQDTMDRYYGLADDNLLYPIFARPVVHVPHISGHI